jgi:hypothetical protein
MWPASAREIIRTDDDLSPLVNAVSPELAGHYCPRRADDRGKGGQTAEIDGRRRFRPEPSKRLGRDAGTEGPIIQCRWEEKHIFMEMGRCCALKHDFVAFVHRRRELRWDTCELQSSSV